MSASALAFDFMSLPAEKSSRLQAITASIQLQGRMALEIICSIGDHLIEAKNMLEYGQFQSWLPTVGLTESTAQNYMNVTRSFGPNMEQPTGTIDLGALYVLATSKVADQIRNDYLKLVDRGEHIAADAARALRDAPLLLRIRYVQQSISGEQFLNLFATWKLLHGSNPRCVIFRKMIEERFTDGAAAKYLFQNKAFADDEVFVMASTGFLAFDGDTIPVERLTVELCQKFRWQLEPPGGGQGGKTHLANCTAKIIEIDPKTRRLTVQWASGQVGELLTGNDYRLVITEA